MNGQKELHISRLRNGLQILETFLSSGINAFDPDFKTWKERTKQSLCEVFGNNHDYVRRFNGLQFWAVRVMVALRPGARQQWSQRDQEIFDNDLQRARNIVSDALEEARIVPSKETVSQRSPASPSPQVVVNVTNVLSQTTHVELKQVISALESMRLSPDDLAKAKEHAQELSQEAQGKQRWPVLAKSLEGLKSLGKSVYENVALPLLLEMLKKQTGVGD